MSESAAGQDQDTPPRPPGRGGDDLHRRPQRLLGLHADALWRADRTIRVADSAAERRPERQHGAADCRGSADRAGPAEAARLSHGVHREVASGVHGVRREQRPGGRTGRRHHGRAHHTRLRHLPRLSARAVHAGVFRERPCLGPRGPHRHAAEAGPAGGGLRHRAGSAGRAVLSVLRRSARRTRRLFPAPPGRAKAVWAITATSSWRPTGP